MFRINLIDIMNNRETQRKLKSCYHQDVMLMQRIMLAGPHWLDV